MQPGDLAIATFPLGLIVFGLVAKAIDVFLEWRKRR